MVMNRGSLEFLTFAIISLLSIVMMCLPNKVNAVGCYVCNSINGSDPTCYDPFHPANGTYVEECMDGKPDVVGLFPTRYCIKMSGYRWLSELSDYTFLYIRRCAVESLGHQSGTFVWGGHTYTGSILTCDYDGCNAASRVKQTEAFFFVFLTSAIVFAWMHIRIRFLT